MGDEAIEIDDIEAADHHGHAHGPENDAPEEFARLRGRPGHGS